MTEQIDKTASITGVWEGLYMYEILAEPGAFTATLLQFGPVLSGTVHEPDPEGLAEMGLLYADLAGRISGTAVEFTKTYDGTSGWDHTVHYAGELSADGLEIEGVWAVTDDWRGRFLMIRSGGQMTAERRLAFQNADD